MAIVAKNTTASMDASTGMYAPQITGLVAGEALAAADACYIAAVDGRVYRCNAAALGVAARLAGFTPRAVAIGQPVTLFSAGARFDYGAGLTPGAILYLAAAPNNGQLDTVATVGDPNGVARVLDATDIQVTRLV